MACTTNSDECNVNDSTGALEDRADEIEIYRLEERAEQLEDDPASSRKEINEILDEIKNATKAAKSRLSAGHYDLQKRQDTISTVTVTTTHIAVTTASDSIYDSTQFSTTETSTATSTTTVATSTVVQTVLATANSAGRMVPRDSGAAMTAGVASWVSLIYLLTMIWKLVQQF
ncbi:hypothetical protein TWF694_001162 [Orbilia ellipsospora]|uniref:Uncharacterized protein n=1 Tax=Orbilia ellipsospora TaxID=2528407 RepID=A0AAV9XR27_9PEZI